MPFYNFLRILRAKVRNFSDICKVNHSFPIRAAFLCLGLLGFKEFLFRMAQTIISMFAMQTRAAHLLLDCPPDTLRCALTASQSSVDGEVGEWGR